GTSDEYVLPEELVESACSLVRLVLRGPEILRGRLTRNEIESLEVFLANVERIDIPSGLSAQQLIETNESWCAMRREASECLERLGISLSEWERKELCTP